MITTKVDYQNSYRGAYLSILLSIDLRRWGVVGVWRIVAK